MGEVLFLWARRMCKHGTSECESRPDCVGRPNRKVFIIDGEEIDLVWPKHPNCCGSVPWTEPEMKEKLSKSSDPEIIELLKHLKVKRWHD